MTYLILSDIHANLEALDAVLAAAGDYDHALVLGDLVGYGADPNEVVARVRALPSATIIRGNHDKVATRLASVEHFNHLARFAIQWTAEALTPDNHQWLAALPAGPVAVDDLVEICHGLAVRRRRLHLRRPGCPAGAGHGEPAAVPVRTHPRAGGLQAGW